MAPYITAINDILKVLMTDEICTKQIRSHLLAYFTPKTFKDIMVSRLSFFKYRDYNTHVETQKFGLDVS